MKASQLRVFEDPGIVASVILVGAEMYPEIAKDGTLKMPAGVEPKGFHVVVAFDEPSRIIVVQKNVGTEGGGYHSDALSKLAGFGTGFKSLVMREPIEVFRAGANVWTSWHQQRPNRVDCWVIRTDGKFGLFQVGVFTHDNGETYKLHGEYRWMGQLYQTHGKTDMLVGVPAHPKWGSLEGGSSRRTQIFAYPEFKALLKGVELPVWKGTDLELDPPLPDCSCAGPNHAVVQWFISFAGQTGQGLVNLPDGTTAWVHGSDIVGLKPDNDGEVRLWRGDAIAFDKKVQNWGSKRGGPPKLTGVKLVKRAD